MRENLILATLVVVASLPFGTCAVAATAGSEQGSQVGKHKMLELAFTASSAPTNPFDTCLLKLEVTNPAGEKLSVEGFYDGDGNGGQKGNVWKVRLCPCMTGTWRWRTIAADASDSGLAGHSGQFTCVESGDLGGLMAQGRYFRLQDGDYFYPVGHFLDVPGKLPLWSYLGEQVTDPQRSAILARQRNFHGANKYMFYMSNHSDASWDFKEYVTPWVGDHASSDKRQMDLARWRLYDGYLQQMKDSGMLAYMSIFEDGKRGNYGDLPESDRNRLLRYIMARTSAYSHIWYVLCFEWQEAWKRDEVVRAGTFLQDHNPWKRLISVHDWAFRPWVFSDQAWAAYIPAQCGNEEKDLVKLNDYVTGLRSHSIPVLADEFGYEETDLMRSKVWTAFCGGAAGVGTGHHLKAFQRFLAQSRVPFQRMAPCNDLVETGGATRFCLAEAGRHYVVYSTSGSFTLTIHAAGLKAYWFNPRDPDGSLGAPFNVPAGASTFTLPEASKDWVLWVTDGMDLNSGVTHPSAGATVVQVVAGK